MAQDVEGDDSNLYKGETLLFRSKQIWSYRHREGEESSTIVVIDVSDDVVHVLLRDISIETEEGNSISELFLPISTTSLSDTVVRNVSLLDEARFEEIRTDWIENHDTRGQGSFTVPIDELLNGISNKFD